MSTLITILILTIAVFITGMILPGVAIKKPATALLVAVILAILNAFVEPIISPLLGGVLLRLPFVTYGLVAFLVNVISVLIASAVVPDFKVKGFLWAVVFAFLLSLVVAFLSNI